MTQNTNTKTHQENQPVPYYTWKYFITIYLYLQYIVHLQVTKVRPNDQDAKMKFNECNKMVKKIAFEKAISVDNKEVNIADSINLESMSKF